MRTDIPQLKVFYGAVKGLMPALRDFVQYKVFLK